MISFYYTKINRKIFYLHKNLIIQYHQVIILSWIYFSYLYRNSFSTFGEDSLRLAHGLFCVLIYYLEVTKGNDQNQKSTCLLLFSAAKSWRTCENVGFRWGKRAGIWPGNRKRGKNRLGETVKISNFTLN